jgi:hypothetical protein
MGIGAAHLIVAGVGLLWLQEKGLVGEAVQDQALLYIVAFMHGVVAQQHVHNRLGPPRADRA